MGVYIDKENEQKYIVTELMGKSLHKILQDSKREKVEMTKKPNIHVAFTFERKVQLLINVVQGIHYLLDETKTFHRDLKAANILVS